MEKQDTTTAEETKKKTTVKKTAAKVDSSLTVSFFGADGKEAEAVNLPESLFGVKPNKAALAQYVRVYLINQRQGNASAKTRAEVAGTTKKMYRQKGTGKARHGSMKAPIFKGGGVVGGPKPREFEAKINKKVSAKVLAYALSLKAQEKAVVGVADEVLKMDGKSKTARTFFKNAGLADDKMLIVLPDFKAGFVKAARNFPNVTFANAGSLNVHEILNAGKLVLAKESLTVLAARA